MSNKKKTTFMQIDVKIKEELEAIKKEKELVSMSAVVRLLLEKCGGKI